MTDRTMNKDELAQFQVQTMHQKLRAGERGNAVVIDPDRPIGEIMTSAEAVERYINSEQIDAALMGIMITEDDADPAAIVGTIFMSNWHKANKTGNPFVAANARWYLSIADYDEDERQLWEIPEVRDWCKRYIEQGGLVTLAFEAQLGGPDIGHIGKLRLAALAGIDDASFDDEGRVMVDMRQLQRAELESLAAAQRNFGLAMRAHVKAAQDQGRLRKHWKCSGCGDEYQTHEDLDGYEHAECGGDWLRQLPEVEVDVHVQEE